MIRFLVPEMILLALLPFAVYLLLPPAKGQAGDALKVPFINDFAEIEHRTPKASGGIQHLQTFNRYFKILYLIWLLFVIAAMRPVEIGKPVRIQSPSRDILLVTDISTSMQQADFSYKGQRLDRLSAVKAVVSDFIANRHADRIGLILFGTRAYLQAPLTFDKPAVFEVLDNMTAGMAGDSTAIGDALGLALKTLKSNKDNISDKMIILLTDGENNDGSINLPQAINMARKENVKVYTIGVGSSMSMISSFFGIKDTPFDEQALKQLAQETQGKYFHAQDLNSLAQIYQAIDRLEPENSEQNFIYPQKELYYWFLLAAIASLLLFGYYNRRSSL